ncbi:GNAT family N-acetyltransferase [Solidesulfovibrio sp.]|uniref:GNAT family N-acetyltransferase n=1 Tax=Solidesulfovibrio sp. TaxID=2910990 RepID=UPI00260599D7|nr:GNAT family N-acetyltransferase [Solidesulfovibrio sp.]
MRVSLAGEADRAAWDAFVALRPETLFYHRFAWRDAVVAAYGERPHYLMARDETGDVRGVLPLFLVRGLAGKARLLSVPHAQAAGLAADDSEAAAALTAEAENIARKLAGGRMTWREPAAAAPDPDWPGLSTYRLPLPGAAETLWKSLRPEIRNRTRKAEKSGVAVAEGRELLPDFCRVYERHMRELGTPPHPSAFFAALVAAEPRRVTVSLATLDGEPVAGMIRVAHGDADTAVWVSSLASAHAVSPVNLLYWRALEAAVARGAATFDFGRGRPGAGPTVFKTRFGAVPHALTRRDWPERPDDPAGDADAAPAMEAVSRLWRRLPLGAATFLGRRLRRFLP